MNQKITVRTLRELKARGEKILMLTAYDACTAAWAEAAGVPTILVGDSMGNTVLGYSKKPCEMQVDTSRSAERMP